MGIHVRRWGNSAAVRIPASALASARLKLDDAVTVREEGGRIVIEAAPAEALTLDALLAAITLENVHAETDWGAPQGKEIW